MAQTVFSNGRNTFDTVLVGTTVTMRGQATIGDTEVSFYGQISKNENNEYVGDYSQTNLSISDVSRMEYLIESATLLKQLSDDVTEKQGELRA